MSLIVTMRPNKCSRCNDVFYNFPISAQEHNETTCIICGFYTYDMNQNIENKLYLEDNNDC